MLLEFRLYLRSGNGNLWFIYDVTAKDELAGVEVAESLKSKEKNVANVFQRFRRV